MKAYWLLAFACLICLLGCATKQPIPEPEVELEPVVVEEPTPEPVVEEPEPEGFVVTDEVYQETFGEIEVLIEELNQIIAGEQLEVWLSKLTPSYIEHYSDVEILNEFTRKFRARGYNIRITDIEDYFTYVVVSSRFQARLDEVNFLGENEIEALMIVDGTAYLLYYLVRADDGWKISIQEPISEGE